MPWDQIPVPPKKKKSHMFKIIFKYYQLTLVDLLAKYQSETKKVSGENWKMSISHFLEEQVILRIELVHLCLCGIFFHLWKPFIVSIKPKNLKTDIQMSLLSNISKY
jgi:hypothetical protein